MNLTKNVLTITLFIVVGLNLSLAQTKTLAFKALQLKNAKVKDAYEIKWPILKHELKALNVNPETFDIYFREFKLEKQLEVWVKNPGEPKYKLLKTYNVCASSGVLGPKRKEGDGQVPEGFYKIDLFNNKSDYYLSVRINYPNSSDLLLKDGLNAGGAIMIHGSCVTIGCLPMTDEYIKEIYVLCLEARNRNNPIYIDLFPAKFTPENIKMMEKNYSKQLLSFWKTLEPAYSYFETYHWLPKVNIDKNGKYFYEE